MEAFDVVWKVISEEGKKSEQRRQKNENEQAQMDVAN